jgi:hypothetical protein
MFSQQPGRHFDRLRFLVAAQARCRVARISNPGIAYKPGEGYDTEAFVSIEASAVHSN